MQVLPSEGAQRTCKLAFLFPQRIAWALEPTNNRGSGDRILTSSKHRTAQFRRGGRWATVFADIDFKDGNNYWEACESVCSRMP